MKDNVFYRFKNENEMLLVPEEIQREIIEHFAVSNTEELTRKDIPHGWVKEKSRNSNCKIC